VHVLGVEIVQNLIDVSSLLLLDDEVHGPPLEQLEGNDCQRQQKVCEEVECPRTIGHEDNNTIELKSILASCRASFLKS
jgi:hypothetical protein